MATIFKADDSEARGVETVQADDLEEFPEEAALEIEFPEAPVENAEEGEEEEVLDPEALRQAVLSEAREEARRLVEEASQEAYAVGLEKGQEAFKASIAECAEALKQASQEMLAAREQFLDSLEPQVLELAGLIARQVLAREAREDPALIHSTVRRALEHISDTQKLLVRVSPEDLRALREHEISLLDDFEGVGSLELVGDEAVSKGGCIIDSESMQVDARLETLLENLLNALRG